MRRPIDLEQLRCRAEHLVRRALELPRELLGRLEAHRAEHQETARRLESLQRDAARLDSRLDGRHQHQERLERRLAELEQRVDAHRQTLDAHRDRLLALDELAGLARTPLAELMELLGSPVITELARKLEPTPREVLEQVAALLEGLPVPAPELVLCGSGEGCERVRG